MKNTSELDFFLKEQIEILEKVHVKVDTLKFKPRNDRYFKCDLMRYLDKYIKSNLEDLFISGRIFRFEKHPYQLSELIIKVRRSKDKFVYKRLSDIRNLEGVITLIEPGSHGNYLIKTDQGYWFRISLSSGTYHCDIEVSKVESVPGRYTANELGSIIYETLLPIMQHDFGHDGTMDCNQYYMNLIECLIPNITKYEQIYNSYNFDGYPPVWEQKLYPNPIKIYAQWGEYCVSFPTCYLRRDLVRQMKDCILYNLRYCLKDFDNFAVIIKNVEVIDLNGKALFENAISEILKI